MDGRQKQSERRVLQEFTNMDTTTHKDPVCGMQIEEADAAGQSEYEGQTIYFCSSACKEKFDANPTQFTNESENQ